MGMGGFGRSSSSSSVRMVYYKEGTGYVFDDGTPVGGRKPPPSKKSVSVGMAVETFRDSRGSVTSSLGRASREVGPVVVKPVSPPNPNPARWIIESETRYPNGWVVALVFYPGCTNYEGRKILVFDDGDRYDFLVRHKILDPHFDDRCYSPVARFEPTARGVDLANALAAMAPKSEKVEAKRP